MKTTDVKVKVKEIDRIMGGSEWESTLYDLRSWELTEDQINEIINGGSVKVSTERRSLLITKKEETPQHPSKMKAERITPTKKHPVFTGVNGYEGYFISNGYKEWEVKSEKAWLSGETIATDLTEAIAALHRHIADRYADPDDLKNANPKVKFIIEMIDGTLDKYGEPKRQLCYSITIAQAKKYRIL